MRTPGLSPDGSKIVFSYDSDLWIVSSNGGTAYRLTAMDGNELYPRFSPDGKWIAFSSSQGGNSDVFLIPVSGGKIRQLTFHDSQDSVDSWSWDSKYIYFTSMRHNNFSSYKVNREGGTPVRIFKNFFNTVHNVVEDPGSPALYFTDTWESLRFASRKGYKGDYNPDIKSYDPETGELISHTKYIGKDLWHSVDRDGNIYFASDEGTNEYNLHVLKDGKKITLTKFKDSIKYPQVCADGSKVVFEKGYRLFLYDTKKRSVSGVKIDLYENNKLKLTKDFNISGKISYFDISPDGKKIAFVSRGELFVSDIKGEFVKKMGTDPEGRVIEVKWLSNSRSLFYNQTKDGYLNLFRFENGKEVEITAGTVNDRNISLSSKRDKAVYLSGKRFIKVLDLKSFKTEIVAEDELWGFYNSTPRFSPDDKFIVFTAYRNFEQDIILYDLRNKKKINITNSGVTESRPFWSPDGKYLFFEADRFKPQYPRGGIASKIYALPLMRFSDKFRSDKWDELFKKEIKAEKGKKDKIKKPAPAINVSIDYDRMEKRWEQISPSSGSQSGPVVYKDGEKLIVLYVSDHEGGGYHLYKTTMDPFKKLETKKIKSPVGYNYLICKSGKKYYLLRNGKIGILDMKGNKFTPIKMNYRFRRNLHDEFYQMFYETWANLEINFYDEKFHGVNWSKMKEKYSKLLPELTSRSDLKLLINDMLGELNSSHLGFYSNGDEEKTFHKMHTSETGIMFDNRDPYKVFYVLRYSPADKKEINLKRGDILESVNGVTVDTSMNREFYFSLPSLEKELKLIFRRGETRIAINIHPVSNREIKKFMYDKWIDNNQKRVNRKSDKKIAYVHMKDMGVSELKSFIIDMTTEWYKKDALILDLRYNRGGNVHDDVLNFLSQKAYSYWKYRGGEYAPQPNFAPSSKPIVMLLNQQSLSDAEMTGAGFKELKLGKIVGTETYRWIIFTSGKSLVDGSFYRLPSWGCYTLDKKDLEKTGVKPDIYIKNTLKDRLEGKDPQLDKAIEIILDQLKK
ncbi:MAG: S41 family peptidase [Acidobacteriota bacterium]